MRMDARFVFRGRLQGHVLDTVEGISIEIAAPGSRDPLGVATRVSADGEFSTILSADAVFKIFRAAGDGLVLGSRLRGEAAELQLRIVRNDELISIVTTEVTAADLLEGTMVVIEEEPTRATASSAHYEVFGLVREVNGRGISSAVIEVRRLLVVGYEILGQSTTDADGVYRVTYEFGRVHDPSGPNVPIEVVASQSDGRFIATSGMLCRPAAVEQQDLVRDGAPLRGPSLFELMQQELAPHLGAHDPASFDDRTIEYLACVSRFSIAQLTWFIGALRFARSTELPAELFFALFAQGTAPRLEACAAVELGELGARLQRAQDENLVPPWPDANGVLAAFRTWLLGFELEPTRPGSLGELLTTVQLTSVLPAEFVEGWLTRPGSVREFWAEFADSAPAADVEALEFSLSVASLGGSLPLVRRLAHDRRQGEIASTRELARFTATRWRTVLDDREVGVPDFVVGDSENERKELYAEALSRTFEANFPTEAFTFRLAERGRLTLAAQYVESHPSFDYRVVRPAAYLLEHPPVAGIDAAVLRRELEIGQRLFQIAPRIGKTEVVDTLLDLEIHSAHQLATLDLEEATFRYGERLGEEGVEQVWRAARRVAMTATNAVITLLAAQQGGTSTAATFGFQIQHDLTPVDLRDLFGPLDYCVCTHCRSVLGPAAYLTSLLRFLELNTSWGAYPRLLSRRPELEHILLNCANAETPMPTIDLINEILEREVVRKHRPTAVPPASGSWPQTTWTAAELRAHPEHLRQGAYNTCAEAIYPWTLPFDLRLAEAQGYLEQVGVRWASLLGTFSADPEQLSVLAGRLGLPLQAAELIVDGTTQGLAAAWGEEVDNAELLAGLQDAERFFGRAQATLQSFEAYRRTTYLGSGAIHLEFDTPCQLEGASVQGLSVALLGRWHRFARLQRALGWTPFELDHALTVLGSGAGDPLDARFLSSLVHLRALERRFSRVDRLRLLGWVGALPTVAETSGSSSLFHEVFIEPGVGDNQSPLVNLPAPMASVRDEVAGALRLTSSEYDALLELEGNPAQANVQTLSRLYGWTALADALDVAVAELIAFVRLSGVHPFDSVSGVAGDSTGAIALRSVESFLAVWDRQRRSGATTARQREVLQYAHADADPDRLAPAVMDMVRALQAARAQLAPLQDASVPVRERLREALAALLDEEAAAELHALASEPPAAPIPAPPMPPAFASWLPQPLWESLHSPLPQNGSDPLSSRLNEVLLAAISGVRGIRFEAAILQQLTDLGQIPIAAVQLVADHLRATDTTSALQFAVGAELDLVNTLDFEADAAALSQPGVVQGWLETDPERLGRLVVALRRFESVAWIARTLRLDVEWVGWWLEHGVAFGLIDINALPVEETQDHGPFESWDRMLHLRQVERAAFGNQLRRTFATLTDAQVPLTAAQLSGLADAAQWPLAQLQGLAAVLGSTQAGLRGIAGIVHLVEAFESVSRLGVTPAAVVAWVQDAQDQISNQTAREIKAAVRARFPAERWPSIVGELRDALREQQRDALVAYLLATETYPGVRTPEDLFGYLLIDVQASACQRTSRIVQATLAVQLFVQRALMNLEGTVSLSTTAARRWQWMKNYRVWEANRKIFLYPENWLDPDWREDKSPLFRKFEESIQQSQLEEPEVERAFTSYAEGLHEIGNLRVGGLYFQTTQRAFLPQKGVLHVLAHTMSSPPQYFYRKRELGEWTPWEDVPGKLPALGVQPIMHRGRLLAFWPVVQAMAVEPEPDSTESPRRYSEVRLAWVERRHDGWQSEEMSETVISSRYWEQTKSVASDGEKMQTDQFVLPARYNLTIRNTQPLLIEVVASLENTAGVGFVHLPLPRLVAEGCQGMFEVLDADLKHKVSYLRAIAARPGHERVNHPYNTAPVGQRFIVAVDSGNSVSKDALKNDGLKVPARANVGADYIFTARLIRAPLSFEYVGQRDETLQFRADRPFAFRDSERSFIVWPRPRVAAPGSSAPLVINEGADHSAFLGGAQGEQSASAYIGNVATPYNFEFEMFSHPFSCHILSSLRRGGIDALLVPKTNDDLFRQQGDRSLESMYEPHSTYVEPFPSEEFDFSRGGAYSTYNWELFMHCPAFMARELAAQARFAEAQRWLHYIFTPQDPLPGTGAQRFWRVKPLYMEGQPASIEDLLRSLAGDPDVDPKLAAETLEQIEAWVDRPFQPHALARLRPGAYQRWVVMQYLDLLIAWGDHLFREDTLESINQALQLYVLAAQLLGERPRELPERPMAARSYAQLRSSLDPFGNAFVQMENALTIIDTTALQTYAVKKLPGKTVQLDKPVTGNYLQQMTMADSGSRTSAAADIQIMSFVSEVVEEEPPDPTAGLYTMPVPDFALELGTPRDLYFCIPPNRELSKYWDIVGDRLYKIRNCLNIEGVFRELSLFAPPIDPGLLAQAAGAGVDIASALADLSAPVPLYRFEVMLSLAKEVVSDVRNFGSALLSALQSSDGEQLTELRAVHEVALLDQVRRVKELRLDEARDSIEALQKARDVVVHRRDEYASRKKRITPEKAQYRTMVASAVLQSVAAGTSLAASIVGVIPQFEIGISGFGPHTTANVGGKQAHAALTAIAGSLNTVSSVLSTGTSIAAFKAAEERRQEEWDFQKEQAEKELIRIDEDILVARIREQVAARELEDHDVQRSQSRAVLDFLQQRYTGSELYRWLAKELQRTYYQAYQLAFDLAKRAERCYQFELGVPSAKFLQYGHWDNTRKGLLAGDKLMHDIRRMEVAHRDNNRREYELTKQISLELTDPVSLQQLRETGSCTIRLDESLFDLDHPSHYMRRIKAVRLSMPAVTGPYTPVTGTLSLATSTIRVEPDRSNDPVAAPGGGTTRIAISHAQSDAGMFEANLRDERYLPFEGKGVISLWSLELPALRQFDYRTISDVVLEVQYTAREGGMAFGGTTAQDLATRLRNRPLGTSFGQGSMRMWSLRDRFPSAWAALHDVGEESQAAFDIQIVREHLPVPLTPGTALRAVSFDLIVVGEGIPVGSALQVVLPNGDVVQGGTASVSELPGLVLASFQVPPNLLAEGTWAVSLSETLSEHVPGLIDIFVLVGLSVGQGSN